MHINKHVTKLSWNDNLTLDKAVIWPKSYFNCEYKFFVQAV